MKIRSRVHNYGHEKESSWPPKYGTLDKTPMYIDRNTGELKAGYPPPREVHDVAPMVIFDSMPKEYHQGVGREIESRKEWERADQEAGTVTFGKKEDAAPKVDKANKARAERTERRKAIKETVQHWNENPEQMKQILNHRKREQEIIAKKSGLDTLINQELKKI